MKKDELIQLLREAVDLLWDCADNVENKELIKDFLKKIDEDYGELFLY